MALDWGSLINTLGTQLINTGVSSLFKQNGQQGGLNLGGLNIGTNQLLGAGLLGASAANDKEAPGVEEARQFLRNRFTSPTGLSDQFTNQVNTLTAQYKPLLDQQRQKGITDLQQKYKAAFPATVGAQGPEMQGIADYITQQALPQEQAVIGTLAQNLMNTQGNAATTLLNEAARKQHNQQSNSELSRALGQLGGTLLTGGGTGAGYGTGTASGSGGLDIGSLLGLATGGGSSAGGGIMSLFTDPATGITSLIPAGSAAAGGSGALAGLSSMALPVAAAAGLTYGAYKLGENNPGLADIPGWQKAGLGLLTGGLGLSALYGADKAQKAQKAQFRKDDVSSQLDQVNEIGNIGADFLSQLGVSQDVMNAWESRVKQLAAASEGPGDEQGMAAQELGRLLNQALGGTASAKAPALRQQFISYMTANTFTSGNSSYGGGAPLNFINDWAGMAGLKNGGLVRPGGMAMVGEEGPEVVKMTPRGAMVIPMKKMMGGYYAPSRN